MNRHRSPSTWAWCQNRGCLRRDDGQRSDLKIVSVAQVDRDDSSSHSRCSLYLRSLVAAGYSPRSIEAGRSDLAQFAEFCASLGLEDVDAVTAAHVRAFVSGLVEGSLSPRKRPYARTSVARKLSTVRVFLAFCEREEWRDGNPPTGSALPASPRGCRACSRPRRSESSWMVSTATNP